MKSGIFLSILAASPVWAGSYSSINARQAADTCKITLNQGNGGRKVAIVLDSSGSMYDNDPNNLRITAGKALNKQLIPSGTNGKTADEVAVVDFDYTASVIYPLGDPAGADSSFDSIDSIGGTWIADGITKALDELTKSGHGSTKDRSGIIVLTDGEDSDVDGLIDEIDRAGSLGIRVSFGFLAPPESFLEPTLLEAILKTGGTYMSFDQAENIEPWLFLLLGNGVTNSDKSSSSEQPLLSGITIAKLTGSDDASFSYAASAGEKLVFTVASLSQQTLDFELSHEDGKSIAKNSTTNGENLPAALTFEASNAETLKLVVSATDSDQGIFQVSVNSSLGISGCSLNQTVPSPPTNVTNPSPPSNHSTTTHAAPTYSLPTGSNPPVPTASTPTAGADKVASFVMPAVMFALASLFL